MRKTIYSFKNRASLGINLIPKDSLIEIENSDGTGKVLLVALKSTVAMDENTTVADFLETENYQVVGSVNISGHTDEPLKTFTNKKDQEIIDVDCSKGDYLLEIDLLDVPMIIAEPQNIEYGQTGIIEILNPKDKPLQFDEQWIYTGSALSTIFRYTVLPSLSVVLEPLN